jgi:hypothetical protein
VSLDPVRVCLPCDTSGVRAMTLTAALDGVTKVGVLGREGYVRTLTGPAALMPNPFDGPGRSIRCACAIRDLVHAIGLEI